MPEHTSPEECPEKPERLDGPHGMYHCPYCGQMQMAGLPAISCRWLALEFNPHPEPEVAR